MKKISLILLAFTVVLATGCLKDKGFDNQEYGIKDPSGASTPGVGFNLKGGAGYIRTIGLDVSGNDQAIAPSNVTIGYYTATKAPKDIHVSIALDPSIIDDYNATNGTTIQELDPAVYTLASQDLVIAAGNQNTAINMVVNSTLTLNPSTTYAIAFRIVSADNGVQIASNMDKNLLIFNIKNQYDGRYELTFTNFHPTLNPNELGATVEVEMWTSGPNSVKVYWPDNSGFFNPSIINGALNAFGNQEPEYTIDPTTNAVTVSNSAAAGTVIYSMFPGYNSFYDPATKVIDTKWGYTGANGPRRWTQNFRYLGPR
jgi:hypothetical protein